MEELNGQVLKGFGVKAKRIIKEKTYYICQTAAGMRVVKKSFDSSENIIFQYEIQNHLYNAGFVWTDRYYESTTGKPYFVVDDNMYVMTDMLDYRESDFSSADDINKIVTKVAEMHAICKKVDFKEKKIYPAAELLECYKKNVTELLTIKKRLNNQKRLSDFDVLFLKNYNYYLKLLKQAVTMLEKTGYASLCHGAREEGMICHNLLKEENILVNGDDVYITRFSGATVDYFIGDVASVLRRIVKNANGPSAMPVGAVLELYDKYNPLTAEDIRILQPLLKYPTEFIKICGQYYSKKRSWTPSAVLGRMETAIGLKEKYEKYIAGYEWE